VVLCGCLSDIKRFDSFPRHGVVGVMVYGIVRIGKNQKRNIHISHRQN
jgi:hypothetical protein